MCVTGEAPSKHDDSFKDQPQTHQLDPITIQIQYHDRVRYTQNDPKTRIRSLQRERLDNRQSYNRAKNKRNSCGEQMNDDDHVCLCFRVSKRKIVNYCKREKPARVSLISQCLSAGTGCGWCIPFIHKIYDQIQASHENPELPISPEEYANQRAQYRTSKTRDVDDV